MHSFFEDKPQMAKIVRIGIILFIGLSVVNLYYSIKINRSLNNKLNG